MIPDATDKSNRIRADQVRILDHPVLLGGQQADHGTMAVTPILEGDCIRYLRIQCGCGQTLEVECVYPETTEGEDAQDQESSP